MKILVAGDYCPIGRTKEYLKTEDYEGLFNGFQNIIKEVDYALVNFECPITKSATKINKTGPCIKTEDENALKALKFAGFNMLTLANNHIQDYGETGVLDTIEIAKKNQFDIVGAGDNNESAAIPKIVKIKGITVGIINIAENEFCSSEINYAGANTFDLIKNIKTINELNKKVDKIILVYHGGREHYQLPTPDLRDKFRFFVDCGVDAIVAHHTHCFSGYEYYNNKPIVYSLGNFIFDYKSKYQKGLWTEGMSVILNLESDTFKIELIPYLQGRKENSTLEILNENEKSKFIEKVNVLNNIIVNDKLFYEEWQKYLKTQEKFYLSSLYIKNLYLRAFFMKGILPISWLKSKHNKLILNLMRCEAHHEISKGILSKNKF
jgi:poly-gamma-glutamate synthesis protein (capsule biosynthesis protein)